MSRTGVKIVFKLKDIRAQRDISQNELARLCEMSVTNIQKYEQQKMKSIPFDTLALFCEVLACEPGELFEKTADVKRG
jgi:putative transcriptional regulator